LALNPDSKNSKISYDRSNFKTFKSLKIDKLNYQLKIVYVFSKSSNYSRVEYKPVKNSDGIAITGLNAIPIQEPMSKRRYIFIEIKTGVGISGISEYAVNYNLKVAFNSILKLKDTITGLDALAYNAVYHYLI